MAVVQTLIIYAYFFQELHETYLDLDPVVSVPLKARKRIQINLRVKKSYPFPSYQGLKKDYYFPVIWVEEVRSLLS